MANGVLSSYFEKQKKSNAPTGGVASPYSAPVDVGGAPAGGAGPSTPASAPKGSAGGGTGFVSFGQYFGANAPAVQAQAQQATMGKTRTELGVLQQPGSYEGGSAFDQMLAGGVVQREAAAQQKRQEAADIARVQAEEAARQEAAYRQAAQRQAEAQRMREEEPVESRKSRSRPVGSRFDNYFDE